LFTGSGGRAIIIENVQVSGGESEFESGLEVTENTVSSVNEAIWVWKVSGSVSLYNDMYQQTEVGVHMVNCNPYEEEAPMASASFNVEELNIEFSEWGYKVEDEPANNPLCSSSQSSRTLTLNAYGGTISQSSVGLGTVGAQLNTSQVKVYTESVNVKIQAASNSQGQTASASTLPPNCPVTCNGRGECAGINICQCEPGYYEFDCSREDCGDRVCTTSETRENCKNDCGSRVKTTRINLNFGGLMPAPSCCALDASTCDK